MAEILVVDDEIGIRELLSEILGDEGHSVLLADSAQQARKVRDENPLDLVLLDIWMPDTDGVTLLKEWATGGKLTMPVIMMSGHATIDTAVEATRIGALDFLEKPIALQKLLKAVEQGLARGKAVRLQAQARIASAAEAAPPPPPRPLAPEPLAGATVEFRPVAVPSGAAFHPAAGGAPASGQPGAAVSLRDLPLDLPLREARDAFERAYFEHHLAREMGSMTRVAEKTGLERTHLYRKLKQLGIDLSRGVWRRNQNH
ncbi:MAG: response regulator [Gammaproteobacteria bacterium]|jgi:DNA-binding NtrC family response regulator